MLLLHIRGKTKKKREGEREREANGKYKKQKQKKTQKDMWMNKWSFHKQRDEIFLQSW